MQYSSDGKEASGTIRRLLQGHLATVAPLVAIAVIAALTTSALAGRWRTAVAGPEVIVLGSGDALSVLVRSGPSRLLVASGRDIDDFDRAYGSVLRPTIARLDILIIAATGQEMLVPERLVSRNVGRTILGIRPVGTGQLTGTLAEADVQVMRQPTTIRLNGGVSVSVNPSSDAHSPSPWHILVTYGGSRVLIVPEADSARPVPGVLSAMVVIGKSDFSEASPVNSGGFIVRGKDASDMLRVTTVFDRASTAAPVWVVHDSEFLRLKLGDGHVEIDRADARQLRQPVEEQEDV